ncbi:MAG: DUF4337 domain-containing protein [Chthoniobacter sp.]|nr:DUF4337 domain-containing protein [Chthoniobacter sp.]
MADAPEIPEATDPFEKRVAISIAILAVILSFIGSLGDNAKTDSILKTNEATNQWGYFQAKSIKGQIAAMQGTMFAAVSGAQPDETRATEIARLKAEAERYEKEKEDIKKVAETLRATAEQDSKVNDRCDRGSLMMQIAIVICSVAILSRWHAFWFAGVALGAAGAVVGATAFFM